MPLRGHLASCHLSWLTSPIVYSHLGSASVLRLWDHYLETHTAILSVGDTEHEYPLGCAAGFYGDTVLHTFTR